MPGPPDLRASVTPEQVRLALLAMTLLLVPLDLEVVLAESATRGEELHRLSFFAWDLPALTLLLVSATDMARHARRARDPVVAAVTCLLATYVLSALAHPSGRALHTTIRLLEAVAIAHAVRQSARQDMRLLVWPIGMMVLLQSVLAVVQVSTGEVLGLGVLGEHPPLLPVGDTVMAKGTFSHPYLLAGWSAVAGTVLLVAASQARRTGVRLLVSCLTALAAVPIGLTFSRMGVLGLLLAAPVMAWAAIHRPTVRLPAAGLAIGFLGSSAAAFGGWSARAEQTTGSAGTSADALSSGRVEFLRQGGDLLADSPLLGVGPGQYGTALEASGSVSPESPLFPVHAVPALIAVEAGVLAGFAALALLAVLTWRALRGAQAWCVFAAYVPFVVLDWPYGQPQGLPVLAAWVGAVLCLARVRSAASPAPQPTLAEHREAPPRLVRDEGPTRPVA